MRCWDNDYWDSFSVRDKKTQCGEGKGSFGHSLRVTAHRGGEDMAKGPEERKREREACWCSLTFPFSFQFCPRSSLWFCIHSA